MGAEPARPRGPQRTATRPQLVAATAWRRREPRKAGRSVGLVSPSTSEVGSQTRVYARLAPNLPAGVQRLLALQRAVGNDAVTSVLEGRRRAGLPPEDGSDLVLQRQGTGVAKKPASATTITTTNDTYTVDATSLDEAAAVFAGRGDNLEACSQRRHQGRRGCERQRDGSGNRADAQVAGGQQDQQDRTGGVEASLGGPEEARAAPRGSGEAVPEGPSQED